MPGDMKSSARPEPDAAPVHTPRTGLPRGGRPGGAGTAPALRAGPPGTGGCRAAMPWHSCVFMSGKRCFQTSSMDHRLLLMMMMMVLYARRQRGGPHGGHPHTHARTHTPHTTHARTLHAPCVRTRLCGLDGRKKPGSSAASSSDRATKSEKRRHTCAHAHAHTGV